MRELAGDGTAGAAPGDEPLEVWDEVAAIGPRWAPAASDAELAPVPGRLELHADALVFRADDAIDSATGQPLVSVVAAAAVHEVQRLAPGTMVTPTQTAGAWLPRWQRRLRCPGFALVTDDGLWIFDARHGDARATALAARYGGR
jgi:hypothetical protein